MDSSTAFITPKTIFGQILVIPLRSEYNVRVGNNADIDESAPGYLQPIAALGPTYAIGEQSCCPPQAIAPSGPRPVPYRDDLAAPLRRRIYKEGVC